MMATETCKLCGKAFSSRESLGQHAKDKHSMHMSNSNNKRSNTVFLSVLAGLIFAGSFYILFLSPTGFPVQEQLPESTHTAINQGIITEDPSRGNPDAKVTIVGFEDFQCPFCGRFSIQALPQLEERYIKTGKAKFIYKEFVPTIKNPSYHPQSILAHQAASCANEKGKFWEYHDLLYRKQADWQNSNARSIFKGFAAQLGLNSTGFDDCLNSGKYEKEILHDYNEGVSKGVSGTPTFEINGKRIVGAQPLHVWQQMIEEELRKV
ncbi:MAG: DsbA family protein [Candidatus Aenigmarchaeota archaeon]|nr:DsbA family protein [Candidatus Aenigmarchaeota archaeon]